MDGPGIRYVLFFQGCPLRCRFCHNPDTWEFGAGEEYSADELVEKILPFKPFYRRGGGVTLSGGEPLAQHEFVAELLKKLRANGFHTALDTSGAIPLNVCRDAVDEADMLLLDIKSIDEKTCAGLTGSPDCLKNERAMLEYCESAGKPVWIRHVIVPDITLNYEHLQKLADWLHGFKCVERIEPLPFHKMGEHKWLPGLYTLGDTQPPTEEEMKKVKEILGC